MRNKIITITLSFMFLFACPLLDLSKWATLMDGEGYSQATNDAHMIMVRDMRDRLKHKENMDGHSSKK